MLYTRNEKVLRISLEMQKKNSGFYFSIVIYHLCTSMGIFNSLIRGLSSCMCISQKKRKIVHAQVHLSSTLIGFEIIPFL